jgi:outer membrane protein assembly factor BamB
MSERSTRRRFLRAAGVAAVAGIAGCSALNGGGQPATDGARPTAGGATAGAATTVGETATGRSATTDGDSSAGTTSENSTTAGDDADSGSGSLELDELATDAFRRNLSRDGFVPERTVPGSVERAWGIEGINVGDHTASKASAVAADGSIVIPGDSGEVHSITPAGEINWIAGTHPSAFGIHGTPAVANDTVYVGAYDGALYAFDLATGEQDWRTQLGGSIGGSPAYHEGRLYVAVEFADPSGSLFVVDAVTGAIELEDSRPTDHPHSTPGIDRDAGTISIGSNDGFLYTWEYPSMEFAHAFDAGEDVKAPIATYDGAAFFGSWAERVFRVDLASGTVDWTFETGGNVMSGAGIDTDSGTVYIGSHDQNCYALDAATGEEQWRFETDGWITGCPAVTSEHVVIGSYDGNLYALTKAGEEVWRAENEGQITAAPLVHDGAIYYTERATEEVSGGVYRLVPAG